MASAVIIASKKQKQQYQFDKIASIFSITKKVLRSMLSEYEHYWKEICDKEEREQEALAKASLSEDCKNDEIVIEKIYKQSSSIMDTNYKHYFTMLGIDTKYLNKIHVLDTWVKDSRTLIGHVPKSIDACVIFTICSLYDINIKKTKIASVCGTSTITINKCYNKLLPMQENIIKLLNSN